MSETPAELLDRLTRASDERERGWSRRFFDMVDLVLKGAAREDALCEERDRLAAEVAELRARPPMPEPCLGHARPWDLYQHMLGEAANALDMRGAVSWPEVLTRMRGHEQHRCPVRPAGQALALLDELVREIDAPPSPAKSFQIEAVLDRARAVVRR